MRDGRTDGNQPQSDVCLRFPDDLEHHLGTVVLVVLADVGALGGGTVGETAVAIASAKAGLTPLEGFARGLLCNALVCLAVWLTMGGRSVTDKMLAILFPITAFVAIGLEHSIANWFFLPYGLLVGGPDQVPLAGVVVNLVTVTAGNIVGGTLLVAASVTDKILAILFPITSFVAIGFEHSIANWFFLPYGLLLGGADQVPAAFVLGLDGTGTESFDEVWRFVKESGLYEVQVTVMTAFPGTPLYTRLPSEGPLLREDPWELCTLFDVNFRPTAMSVAELETGLRDLAEKLYSADFTRERRDGYRRRLHQVRR